MRHRARRMLAVLLVAASITALAVCGCQRGSAGKEPSSGSAPESKEPYKIGLLTSLSGSLGFIGEEIRDATLLEVDKVNAQGGIDGHPIEVIIEDDGGDPGKSVTKLTKLVRDDNVLAVTGLFLTALEPALRPIAEREQVTFLSQVHTVPSMRARNDKYWFVDAPSEFVMAAAWIDILKEKGFTRVVANGTNDNLTEPHLEELKKQAAAAGIQVDILPDVIGTDAVDVTPQVMSLKQLAAKTNAQALVTMVWPTQLPAMLRTMKQLGVNLPVITHAWGADDSILRMGGDELNGLIVPGLKVVAGEALPDSDPQKAVILDFKSRYEPKTGKLAGEKCSYARDAIALLIDAIRRAGPNPDRAKVRDALESTKDFVGVVGVFNYSPNDHEGLSKECLALYEIQNKRHVYIKTIGAR